MKIRTTMKNLHRCLKFSLIIVVGLLSQTASATPIFDFKMSGNTVYEPFSISNLSTAGETIESFTLDISGLGFVFDTIDRDGTTRYSKPFTANSGTDLPTGLLSSSGALDNSTLLSVFFNDFNAGETFLFDIDVDTTTNNRAPVYGNELIGSLLSVEFSNGMLLAGSLGELNNSRRGSALSINGNSVSTVINEPSTFALLAALPILLFARRSKKHRLTN